MKILLIRKLIVGGVEASLMRRYLEMKVVTFIKDDGPLPFEQSRLLDRKTFFKKIKSVNQVHVIGLPMLLLMILLQCFYRFHSIVYFHDSKVSKWKLFIIWILSRLTLSNTVFNFPNKETKEIYGNFLKGCNLQLEPPRPFRAKSVKSKALSYNMRQGLRIAIIGRCSEEKNPKYTLDLLRALNEKLNVCAINFYGLGWQEYYPSLASKFNFFGQVNMSDEVFLDNDIVICCSKREAYGLVQVETVLANCILFTTNVGIIQKFVNTQKILINNLQADVRSIISILSAKPEIINCIVKNEKQLLLRLLDET